MDGINIQSIQASFRSFERGFLSVLEVSTTLGYVIAALSFISIIYLIIRLIDIRDRYQDHYEDHFKKQTTMASNPRNEQWMSVKKAIQSEDPSLWRMAIIEADTMLEDLITSMGYQGETFGEKLKVIPRGDAPWLDAAWEVHRLRNILAHEGSRYALHHREAYRAYKIYESILYDSGYLTHV